MADDLRHAKSLAEGWSWITAAFAESRNGPPPANLERQLKDCYYAGAAVMWDVVMRSDEMDGPQGEALMNRLQQELELYSADRILSRGTKH